jgi:hypothetical protein
MMTPLLQASWAAAVTLALYAFYCFWEAGRADLAHSFRHLAPGHPGSGGESYRARARWAVAGALLITLGCFAAAL